jgi:hypothetical protein
MAPRTEAKGTGPVKAVALQCFLVIFSHISSPGPREYCCASMLLDGLQPRLVPALADADERVTTVHLLARSRNDKCPRPKPSPCRGLHISPVDSYLITLIYVMLVMGSSTIPRINESSSRSPRDLKILRRWEFAPSSGSARKRLGTGRISSWFIEGTHLLFGPGVSATVERPAIYEDMHRRIGKQP